MSVLKDISDTSLEGSVRWVDTEDTCNNCGHRELWTRCLATGHNNQLHVVYRADRCVSCDVSPATYTVVKVTPSES